MFFFFLLMITLRTGGPVFLPAWVSDCEVTNKKRVPKEALDTYRGFYITYITFPITILFYYITLLGHFNCFLSSSRSLTIRLMVFFSSHLLTISLKMGLSLKALAIVPVGQVNDRSFE